MKKKGLKNPVREVLKKALKEADKYTEVYIVLHCPVSEKSHRFLHGNPLGAAFSAHRLSMFVTERIEACKDVGPILD